MLSNKLNVSGYGTVGTTVAFDTRGPRFEFSHQQYLQRAFILSELKKRSRMAHYKLYAMIQTLDRLTWLSLTLIHDWAFLAANALGDLVAVARKLIWSKPAHSLGLPNLKEQTSIASLTTSPYRGLIL